jgi:hypothetical protein
MLCVWDQPNQLQSTEELQLKQEKNEGIITWVRNLVHNMQVITWYLADSKVGVQNFCEEYTDSSNIDKGVS